MRVFVQPQLDFSKEIFADKFFLKLDIYLTTFPTRMFFDPILFCLIKGLVHLVDLLSKLSYLPALFHVHKYVHSLQVKPDCHFPKLRKCHFHFKRSKVSWKTYCSANGQQVSLFWNQCNFLFQLLSRKIALILRRFPLNFILDFNRFIRH